MKEKEFIDLGKRVEIPFYYALDDEGNVIIDVESMNKEFEEKMEILSNITQEAKEQLLFLISKFEVIKMKDLTQQEELDREETLKKRYLDLFSKQNLEELYLIQEVLEKEIKLSETSINEGFE